MKSTAVSLNPKFFREPNPWEDQFFTLHDAFALREPLRYILYGLFPIPSLSILYGPPGSLKSLLLAYIATCVAAGTPCLSREVMQAAVLWIDLDNGKRRTDERFAAIARAGDISADVPLYYMSMPVPWLNAGSLKDIETLISIVIDHGIKLICIDNLSLISLTHDENSDEMVHIMSNLRLLSERTGAVVVIIHHQRKGTGKGKNRIGESLRGHSSIEAAIDLALRVEREAGSDLITVTSTKSRDVEVNPFGAFFQFEHKPETTELHKAWFTESEIEDKTSDRAIEKVILSILTKQPGLNQKEVVGLAVRELQAGVNRIRNIYNQLKASGRFNSLEV